MTQRTGIEWTDATWNPITGCTQVSAGCDNCYALTLANRLLSAHYTAQEPVRDTPSARQDPFAVRIWPDRFKDPLSWRTPRRVFVNSMGDLFHTHVAASVIRSIFEVMISARQHVFQVLTKRPARMVKFLRAHSDLFADGSVPKHIWLGTSIESQEFAYRAAHLRQAPAAVRFLSCEPLLGPLRIELDGIHWVIAGGESGISHRPMDLEWARILRDSCVESEVPFFFKQVGGRTPKAGGRHLDGRTWSEYPHTDVRTA